MKSSGTFRLIVAIAIFLVIALTASAVYAFQPLDETDLTYRISVDRNGRMRLIGPDEEPTKNEYMIQLPSVKLVQMLVLLNLSCFIAILVL